MITLDSNILVPRPGRGREFVRLLDPDLQLLSALAGRRRMAMRLPETVVEEVFASYMRAVRTQTAAVQSETSTQNDRVQARRLLLRLVPHDWTYRPEFARGDNAAVPALNNTEKVFREALGGMFNHALSKPAGAPTRRAIGERSSASHQQLRTAGDLGRGPATR